MDRIDALPIRAKVLCGSFAYGYTEKGNEPWDDAWDDVASTAFRVGADVYRYTRPYWYLAVFEPWDYGSDYIGEVCGVWQEVGVFGREEAYTRAFAEHVGESFWRGGLMS